MKFEIDHRRIQRLEYVHGIADYTLGALLLLAPVLCGFADHGLAMSITMTFGLVLIAYSALTDYTLGAMRMIPFGVHLALDALGGGLLIGAPFIFGFADRTWVPHLVIGIFEASFAVAAALVVLIRLMPPRSHHRMAH